MFSYFGSKSKLVNYYPEPKYPRIIEPFAGSARYALAYADRQVTLIERDPIIYGIWKYLIEDCEEEHLDRWPELRVGDDLRNVRGLSTMEMNLLGFAVARGSPLGNYTVSSRADESTWKGSNTEIQRLKNRIRKNLERIRHWRVILASYNRVHIDVEATWFVDPPYQRTGHRYRVSKIDYRRLARWCRERQGQVIVCEAQGARWLPFRRLDAGGIKGSHNQCQEAIWTKGC